MHISHYIGEFDRYFPHARGLMPWHVPGKAPELIRILISSLTDDYRVSGEVAIHKDALVEEGVVLKGPIIISDKVFIGAHSYLRGGVFLAPDVSVGPGCEIKSSIIMPHSALAHFNFVGDSILGTYVNMEAGSIIANYHNDRADRTIIVRDGEQVIRTDVEKFGGIVGDGSKIGANAVLSPGTILGKSFIVKRLELIQQT
jgi:UDP-N-acetylglucosamine diphosphorylase / glucose-1-phosphate thymidylyltransferase / UDP-N-acetylgalactosamine diphosphorylase / glucosamine-1-phosphate N-acetyltransferase / galactosamine-1-phosphate N-acetyltransferase